VSSGFEVGGAARRLHIGTSGYSYPEWRGVFYPPTLKSSEYLGFYSEYFSATEINNTFYRLPSPQIVERWSSQVPEGFRFSIKLNQQITHRQRLQGSEETMGIFLEGLAALRPKLGTVLVQLPPYFKKLPEALEHFLSVYSEKLPLVFEFRHSSWFCDEIFEMLKHHRAVLAAVETDEQPAVLEKTAPLNYVRLRKSRYEAAELEKWAGWMALQQDPRFVFVKHDLQAPSIALKLLQRLA
jgi:uncharacterized protein YecE (DUF72 family)